MANLLLTTTVISGLSLITMGFPVQAEITQKYDQFTKTKTIQVIPDQNWNGQTPKLFINHSFPGDKAIESPSFITFSVIVPLTSEMTCTEGITAMIADGERVLTANETIPFMTTLPKIKPLGKIDQKLAVFVELSNQYDPVEFQKIAAASEVKYQLCNNKEQLYVLSRSEQEDLKEYLTLIMPAHAIPSNFKDIDKIIHTFL